MKKMNKKAAIPLFSIAFLLAIALGVISFIVFGIAIVKMILVRYVGAFVVTLISTMALSKKRKKGITRG